MRLIRLAFLAVVLAGAVAIAALSTKYFILGSAHPFVLEKGYIPFDGVFMLALRVHVVAAAWALPACTALWSGWILRRFPRIHRWLGRITGVVILFALVPSGAWLAFTAKGGAPSTAGFLVSGAIVAVATVQGVRRARARELASHRRWNAQVLGQLSVAVTSRALLSGFDWLGFDPTRGYVVALWAPVIATAWIAHHVTAPGAARMVWKVPRRIVAPLGFAAIVAVGFMSLGRPGGVSYLPPGDALTAIQDDVLEGLSQEDSERAQFSRGSRPASERRIVTDVVPTTDANGALFLTFSIDERHGLRWTMRRYVGCVYPASGKVFLFEDRYVPVAKHFHHSNEAAPPAVCRAAELAPS